MKPAAWGRRRGQRPARTLMEAKGKPHLPGKVGPEKKRIIGTVRLKFELAVLVLAEMVMQKVMVRSVENGIQVGPGILFAGLQEQGLQPGGK